MIWVPAFAGMSGRINPIGFALAGSKPPSRQIGQVERE